MCMNLSFGKKYESYLLRYIEYYICKCIKNYRNLYFGKCLFFGVHSRFGVILRTFAKLPFFSNHCNYMIYSLLNILFSMYEIFRHLKK